MIEAEVLAKLMVILGKNEGERFLEEFMRRRNKEYAAVLCLEDGNVAFFGNDEARQSIEFCQGGVWR